MSVSTYSAIALLLENDERKLREVCMTHGRNCICSTGCKCWPGHGHTAVCETPFRHERRRLP